MRVKIETKIFEYDRCWKCTGSVADGGEWACEKKENRRIEDFWVEIPEWCPLPDKEEEG